MLEERIRQLDKAGRFIEENFKGDEKGLERMLGAIEFSIDHFTGLLSLGEKVANILALFKRG